MAVLLAVERAGSRPGKWIAKPAAAACFLWAALAWGALDSLYGRWILAGLALSACGDVLLIVPGRTRAFQIGIGAFLLGHVAYAGAFAALDLELRVLGVASLLMGLVAWRTLRWLMPHVPSDFRAPVGAYVAVIGTMVVLAFAATAGGAPPLAAIGALAFAASDLSVARDRFVAPGFSNAAWGLPLYFAAQLALASTVATQAGPSMAATRHLLLPVDPVEVADFEGAELDSLETAHIDGDLLRLGAGDAERRDPTDATEVVLRAPGAEAVGRDLAPGRLEAEIGRIDAPVDVPRTHADRAVADLEIQELAGRLVADRPAMTGAAIGRHARPPGRGA